MWVSSAQQYSSADCRLYKATVAVIDIARVHVASLSTHGTCVKCQGVQPAIIYYVAGKQQDSTARNH